MGQCRFGALSTHCCYYQLLCVKRGGLPSGFILHHATRPHLLSGTATPPHVQSGVPFHHHHPVVVHPPCFHDASVVVIGTDLNCIDVCTKRRQANCQFVDFYVPSSAQGHPRVKHTVTVIQHRVETQVIKSQIRSWRWDVRKA